jgi:hypothetical protein
MCKQRHAPISSQWTGNQVQALEMYEINTYMILVQFVINLLLTDLCWLYAAKAVKKDQIF